MWFFSRWSCSTASRSATSLDRLRPGAMRKSQAWQLIQQLGAGLAHAHERGVVHGDLKPRNIFITREGELRILDFGAAHRFVAEKSGSEHADHAPNFRHACLCELRAVGGSTRGSARRSICAGLHLLRAFGGNSSFWIAARHARPGLSCELGTPSWPHRSAVESSAERPVLASWGAFDQCAFVDASIDKGGRRSIR